MMTDNKVSFILKSPRSRRPKTNTNLTPIRKKLIKLIKERTSDPNTKHRDIYKDLQLRCLGKRRKWSHSKESLLRFVCRIKHFIGIDAVDAVDAETLEPVPVLDFSLDEIDFVRRLESAVQNDGNLDIFLSGQENRKKLELFLDRSDVENYIFEDSSDGRFSSSAVSPDENSAKKDVQNVDQA